MGEVKVGDKRLFGSYKEELVVVVVVNVDGVDHAMVRFSDGFVASYPAPDLIDMSVPA